MLLLNALLCIVWIFYSAMTGLITVKNKEPVNSHLTLLCFSDAVRAEVLSALLP